MKRFSVWYLAIAAALTGCAAGTNAQAYDCDTALTRADGSRFELYLGAKIGDEDALAALCLKRLPVLKEVRFRPPGAKELGPVPDDVVRSVLVDESNEPVIVLNIEAWDTTGSDVEVEQNVTKLRRVLATAKQSAPASKIGYYAMVPARDYYRAVGDKGEGAYLNWQRENDRLLPLANDADVLFPSIYTFRQEDVGRWTKYAYANIAEARRLGPGKPIYPFLWNRYHGKANGERPVEPAFFQAQIAAMFNSADAGGAVIWLLSKEPWDESANWHIALRQFLDSRTR